MQQGLKDEALDDFNLAAAQDPENSDIYHHRGQVSKRAQLLAFVDQCKKKTKQLELTIKNY